MDIKKRQRSAAWVLLAFLPFLLHAKTYVLPPDAIPDMEKMTAEQFRVRWPSHEIPDGYYPVEKGHYLSYQHENLTYFFGPYESEEATIPNRETWDRIRKELISQDAKFQSSRVGRLYIDLVGMQSEGGEISLPPAPPVKLDGEIVYKPEEKIRQVIPLSPTNMPDENVTTNAPQKNMTPGKSRGLILPTQEEINQIPLALPPFLGKKLPDAVDLSRYLPSPGNQQPQNACVGWATAYALKSYQEVREEKWRVSGMLGKIQPLHVFSPSFVYNQINKGRDQGSRFIDALKLSREKGAATWHAMPFRENDFTSQPNPMTLKEALAYRIDFYGRVLPEQLDEIKGHLASGYPVLIGAMIDQQFEQMKGSKVWKKQSHVVGPHAMLSIGYNDKKNAIKIINSWGVRWGLRGYGWIDYKLFSTVVKEAYVIKDGINDVAKPLITRNQFNVNITGASSPVRDPSLGEGISIWGTATFPKGISGRAKIVVELFGDKKTPINAIRPNFSTIAGHAAAASRPINFGNEETQVDWAAFLPFSAFNHSKKSNYILRPVFYVDDFGIIRGEMFSE